MAEGEFFVELEIETDAQQLADEAVDRLQDRWPDWEPNDADLEVIQIETLSPMAENAAETAALVPPAILRAYGTKLIGRPYDQGTQADTTVTFTLSDDLGHLIPAEAELDIDGYAFTVDTETEVPVGSTSVSGVSVHAVDTGEAANDLTGDSVVPVSSLSFLEEITLDGPTARGTDPETDEAYQNALSGDLLLQAKTLITTRDFELWAVSKNGIGRASATHTGDRAITVVLTDDAGEVVTTPVKDALAADFDQYRLVNTVLTLTDATYTTIGVAYEAKALPGFDHPDLKDRIDAMLTELLSPVNWAKPKSGEAGQTPEWLNDSVVRANYLIDRIADVEGTNYVESISITGSAGSSSGDNWTMPGTYALPRVGTLTGTIT